MLWASGWASAKVAGHQRQAVSSGASATVEVRGLLSQAERERDEAPLSREELEARLSPLAANGEAISILANRLSCMIGASGNSAQRPCSAPS